MCRQVKTNGPLQPRTTSIRPCGRCRHWGKRADRAYLNAVETFAPFAALVILIHLAGKANATTAFLAASFFWLRVAHAIVFGRSFHLGAAYVVLSRTVVVVIARLMSSVIGPERDEAGRRPVRA